jgi:predicted metal-dependent hydrolase
MKQQRQKNITKKGTKHSTRTSEFKADVGVWSKKVRVKPKQVRVQRMTRKWGSCSTAGWVTFALDLLEQPKSFRDYVIVHELLHMKVPNHGRLFKSLLSAHLPDWQRHALLARQ